MEGPTPGAELPRLHERLAHWARTRPDHPALQSPSAALTFSQLHDAVEAAAIRLRQFGVFPGHVVAFQLPNWLEAFVLYHAILRIDAIALPLLPALRDRDLSYMLRQSQTSLFITPLTWRGQAHADMALRVCGSQVRIALLREPDEEGPLLRDLGWGQNQVECVDDPTPASRGGALGSPLAVCSMIFTSGTSGRPKAVMYSQECLGCEGRDMARADSLHADDVLFVPSSIGHVAGISFGIFLPMYVGATVCLLPEWNAQRGVEFIARHQCTWAAGATPFLQGIVEWAAANAGALNNLRVFRCGGASVPPKLIRQARALGIDAYRSYGMSEHPTISGSAGQPENTCMNTDGVVHPLVEVRIVDPGDAARVLEPDEAGEILVRGPDTSLAYLRIDDTEASRVAGWVLTGDLGKMSADRILTVTGRKKDVIIRKGEKISAKEIEDLLADHPNIADVAVIGLADAERGEMVCCAMVAKAGHSPSLPELCTHLRRLGLPAFKLPERLVLVEQLPYNPGGKVLKTVLKSQVMMGLGTVDEPSDPAA